MLNIRIHNSALFGVEYGRRLSFYLAAEEWLSVRLGEILPEGEKEAGFLWKVPPTVIFGRNQDLEAEVNIDYCRSHGVDIVRRKSGGGAVYADMGNIMLSCVTTDTDVERVFKAFMERYAAAVSQSGVHAEVSGRNDILVRGRKVSGNAFFLTPGAGIVHGTLMYSVDVSVMEQALLGNGGKVRSVASVRRRVINLSEVLPQGWTQQRLEAVLARELFDGDFKISEGAIAEIEEIEKDYINKDFI